MLTKEEIKEYVLIRDSIEVTECYGVKDLKRRMALENKANEKQAEVISEFKNHQGLETLEKALIDTLEGRLCGCISKDGCEIDGKEFEVSSLVELVDIMGENKEIHLNYFSERDGDLDLLIKIE